MGELSKKAVNNEFFKASLGLNGIRVLTGSSVSGEKFIAFKVIEDCSIGWTCNNDGNGDASVSDLDFVAGDVINMGEGYDIVVESGKVLAYLV